MPTKKLQMLGYKIVPPEHIGLSAFEIAVENGFEGNEAEWLEYLATLKIHSTSNLNEAIAPGLYRITGDEDDNTHNLPQNYDHFKYGTVIVENNDAYISQTISYANVFAKRYYSPSGGVWTEWEYVNPPYITDIEYRTTDRINNKAVIKKISQDGILRYRLDGESTWRTYQESLGISQTSLGINQESLGINLESIGAAPAGYGIGALEIYSCASDEDVDRVLTEQIGSMGNQSFKRIVLSFTNTSNFSNAGGNYYTDIYKLRAEYAAITVKSYVQGGRTLQRVYTKETGEAAASFKPWEWVNPPLKTGVVYRTTDRIDGLAVYKMVDENGKMQYAIDDLESGWVPYYYHFGAAPDGYGLGGAGQPVRDMDTAVNSGFYALAGDECTNSPEVYENFKYGTLLVENYNHILIKQTFFHNGITAIRYRYNGYGGVPQWSELEFVNPPFEYDSENTTPIEYRTTKRILNTAVYERFQPYGDPYSTNWAGSGKLQYRLEGSTTWIDYSSPATMALNS